MVVVDGGAASAVGGRADNQDRCDVQSRWGLVSDGAGGHAGGARAAELTLATLATGLGRLSRLPDAAVLRALVGEANAAVNRARDTDPSVSSMAATVTAAVATAVDRAESRWLVANVGDSPAWHATDGQLRRLTREHNLAAELVRAGALSPDEARTHPARHRITRAIGGGGTVDVDVAEVVLGPDDRLVLASDGIEVVTEAELAGVIAGAPTAQAAAERAVQAALDRGATDNVTVVVLRHLPSFGDVRRR